MLGAWWLSRHLDRVRRTRVRGKVERWLRSFKVLETRRTYVKIPSNDMCTMATARSLVRHGVRQIRLRDGDLSARFAAAKISLVNTAARSVGSRCEYHRNLAKSAGPHVLAGLDETAIKFYMEYRDCRCDPMVVSMQGQTDAEEVGQVVWQQVGAWLQGFGHDIAVRAERDDLVASVQAQLPHERADLEVVDAVRARAGVHSCLVPPDRDTKRRAIMSDVGYQVRLWLATAGDTS